MKLWFDEFWSHFNKHDNFFTWVLRKYGNTHVEVTSDNPDVIIVGNSYRYFDPLGPRRIVCFVGENNIPVPTAQANLTPRTTTEDNNLRLPLWYLYVDWEDPLYFTRFANSPKLHFCNFIHAHTGYPRQTFIDRVNQYKRVDCHGRAMNNMGAGIWDNSINGKLNVQKHYLFSMCLENALGNGYVTEKLLHGMVARTIPIYWGDKTAFEDFNPEYPILQLKDDISNLEQIVAQMIEIDQNETIKKDYLERCSNTPILTKMPDFEKLAKHIIG